MQLKQASPSDPTDNRSLLSTVKALLAKDAIRASLFLLLILNIAFFPCVWGHRTFLESSRDATSILSKGSFAGRGAALRFHKTLDPGASGWVTEPLFQLIRHQYFSEGTLPLWNPYQGYGTPLAANMQSQPFSPFTLAVLPRLTPITYNFYILLRLFFAGLSAFLFLRFFISFLPALGGAVSCMLTGYYVLFLNMPSLSAEVMLPTCFWAAEWLLRKRDFLATGVFSCVVAASILGGMPESSLLCLSFTACYLAFRILSDQTLRSKLVRPAALSFIGFLLAAALVSFLTFPFLEYMRLSWNSHDSAVNGGLLMGSVADRFDSTVITYLVPMIFGPLYTHPAVANPLGYWGVAAFFFALLSVVAYIRRRDRAHLSLQLLTLFFAASVLLMLAKRFGVPLVQNIGSLPFFSLILFPKYDEVLLGFAMSALCGLGLEGLATKRVSTRAAASIVVLFLALLAIFLLRARHTLVGRIDDIQVPSGYIEFALAVSVATLLLILLAFFLKERVWNKSTANHWGVAACVAILAFELSANYIIPNYLVFGRAPRAEDSPYKGAPYVTMLEHNAGNDRIFGRDLVLTPSWASAFQVQDIRALDAMYYNKYFNFLYNFFPAHATIASDLNDRFFGQGPYEFSVPLERRLLQLSSVKYICTDRPYAYSDPVLDEIWKQNQGRLDPAHANQIDRKDVLLDHTSRQVLWEHPPYSRLPYRVQVPVGDDIFHISYSLHPDAFDKTAGDGIGFTVEVRDRSGQITKLFSDYIDPKHNLKQQHWLNASFDLKAFKNQSVELLFSTDPGPSNDTSYDWAIWSNFHFEGASAAAPAQPFTPIYAGETNIYSYENVLPRAALFYHADVVNTPAEVLKLLGDPSFDIFRKTVVNANELSAAERDSLQKLSNNPDGRADSAQITSYRSQSVMIHAAVRSPAVLVLNDSDYPGWIVEVDGKPAHWFTANYMFRGLLLSSGSHSVHFLYRPRSFAIGRAVSLLGLAVLLVLVFLHWRLSTLKRTYAATDGYSS